MTWYVIEWEHKVANQWAVSNCEEMSAEASFSLSSFVPKHHLPLVVMHSSVCFWGFRWTKNYALWLITVNTSIDLHFCLFGCCCFCFLLLFVIYFLVLTTNSVTTSLQLKKTYLALQNAKFPSCVYYFLLPHDSFSFLSHYWKQQQQQIEQFAIHSMFLFFFFSLFHKTHNIREIYFILSIWSL